jgi:hypothetical protein
MPVFLDRSEELDNEPALADTGHADERDQLRRALLAHARKRRDEQLELAAAADERRDRPLRDVDAEARAGLQRLPGADRLSHPLANHRLCPAVVDRLRSRPVGLLADEDPVQGRGRLQAHRRVDEVACGHRLTLARLRAERDQRLARVDRDPYSQLLALLAGPVTDRERCPHGPLGVVLVRDRRPEQRHPGPPRGQPDEFAGERRRIGHYALG